LVLRSEDLGDLLVHTVTRKLSVSFVRFRAPLQRFVSWA
jgi:hypothetical protein